MKTLHLAAALVAVGLLAGPIAACSSSPKSESTGEYIDDAAISGKVRATLLGDKDLNVFQIDVTTYKGVVQLSGFVDSPAAKARASSVVRGINGVRSISNNLIVK